MIAAQGSRTRSTRHHAEDAADVFRPPQANQRSKGKGKGGSKRGGGKKAPTKGVGRNGR